MAKEINDWLKSKNKNYDTGIALLMKYSKNRGFILRITRKPWPEKLEYELQKIYDRQHPVKTKPKPEIKPDPKPEEEQPEFITDPKKRKIIVREQEIKLDDLPKKLQKLWHDNAEMYKESRSLHEKLKLMKDVPAEKRAPIVERLQDLGKITRQNWDIIDAYDPDAEPETAEMDHKKINANRTFISRNLKKVEDNPKHIVFVKIQDRIDELLSAGEVFKADQAKRLKKLGFTLNA